MAESTRSRVGHIEPYSRRARSRTDAEKKLGKLRARPARVQSFGNLKFRPLSIHRRCGDRYTWRRNFLHCRWHCLFSFKPGFFFKALITSNAKSKMEYWSYQKLFCDWQK